MGPTLEEVDFNTLEPELKILKNEEVEDSTRQIHILRKSIPSWGRHCGLNGSFMWKFLGKHFWNVA